MGIRSRPTTSTWTCIAVAKDNPWPVYGTQELGATGTGLNVYVGNGAGDGLEKYLTIGLTKSWDPNDPNSVRGDGMTNSQFQDQLNAREWLKAQQESFTGAVVRLAPFPSKPTGKHRATS